MSRDREEELEEEGDGQGVGTVSRSSFGRRKGVWVTISQKNMFWLLFEKSLSVLRFFSSLMKWPSFLVQLPYFFLKLTLDRPISQSSVSCHMVGGKIEEMR